MTFSQTLYAILESISMKDVSSDFLKLNNDNFGYKRFDFLYLQDSDGVTPNLTKLKENIINFFTVNNGK